MGENLGEAGEETEAAGQTRTGAETEEVRVSSGGDASAAGGSLYSDNLDLFETAFSASLSFLRLLVVEATQDDEEDSLSCEKEAEETRGSKEETGDSRESTKQWSEIEETEWTREEDEWEEAAGGKAGEDTGIVEAPGGKAEHMGKLDEAGGKNGKYTGRVEAPAGKAGADIEKIEEAEGKAEWAGQKTEADIGMGKKGKIPAGNEGEKDWAAEEEGLWGAWKKAGEAGMKVGAAGTMGQMERPERESRYITICSSTQSVVNNTQTNLVFVITRMKTVWPNKKEPKPVTSVKLIWQKYKEIWGNSSVGGQGPRNQPVPDSFLPGLSTW